MQDWSKPLFIVDLMARMDRELIPRRTVLVDMGLLPAALTVEAVEEWFAA